MKKLVLFIMLLVSTVTNAQSRKSSKINYGLGIKAGFNGTKTNYIDGGTFDLYFDTRKDKPKIGWNILGSVETESEYPVQFEICLGLKKSSSFLVASSWDEDIIDQMFEVFYLSMPFCAKIELYRCLPDVLVGVSINFPFNANYISNGHYRYNRYKESVNTDFLDVKTSLSIGIGKNIKISSQSLAIEFKYLFHFDNIEYEKMGVFSNDEFQFLFTIPLFKSGGNTE